MAKLQTVTMNNKYLVIDPCSKNPALSSFNFLVNNWEIPMNYLLPALFDPDYSDLNTRNFRGIIIFGSHSNIEDKALWHSPLKKFLLGKLEKGTPVLGICFGHQLMADVFGAKIIKNSSNKKLEGVRHLIIENEFLKFKKGDEYPVFVSHSFQIDHLPKELITLSSSKDCPHEIVAHTSLPYLGIQGHPEGTLQFVSEEIETHLSETQINHAQWGGKRFLQHFKQLCENHWSN